MKSVIVVSVFVFIVLLSLQGALGIRCFICNSLYDAGCADFFDNSTYPIQPCNVTDTMCRKMVQETYYDGHWDVRYIRSCAREGEVGADEGRWCKERSGTYRVKVKYCHCVNKDGCNTATTRRLSSSALLPLAFITLGYLQRTLFSS
ncbi:uncharacterized protein LOC106167168 [Lingula anatina]|uniref:Uncharacterized protein LOC106167168 n=1 Tax=Lingula anatina TaxID=7574 RepID=A0A1S3ITS0_LINAN|nr:uncharacterized protein LOC106167168 [Lingula anatina]|eukprot:XP_013401331.1 uncharacterized protein LOC106167168 [Lingula anatina]